MRILLIEDDKQMALTIKERLNGYYIVEVVHTGEEGEYNAQINEYDVILLDYVLPDKQGIQVCRTIRAAGVKDPILILTGQFEVDKKVEALDSGADDYLIKPFSFEELFARIRALLRRQNTVQTSSLLTVGDLTLDTARRIVKRNKKVIPLRRKELYLLEYLMRNPGRIITRDMIFDHVWDSTNESMTNIVDVHIKYLRDRIDKSFSKKLIKTVHGLGYKIEE